jgi:hypothetical protein
MAIFFKTNVKIIFTARIAVHYSRHDWHSSPFFRPKYFKNHIIDPLRTRQLLTATTDFQGNCASASWWILSSKNLPNLLKSFERNGMGDAVALQKCDEKINENQKIQGSRPRGRFLKTIFRRTSNLELVWARCYELRATPQLSVFKNRPQLPGQ